MSNCGARLKGHCDTLTRVGNWGAARHPVGEHGCFYRCGGRSIQELKQHPLNSANAK